MGRAVIPKPLGLKFNENRPDLDPYAPPALTLRDAAAITMEPVTWLWPGRIAVGKLTLITGEPGTAKSQVAIAVASAVTNGARWPCDDDTAPVGSVAICAVEDDAADTIKPRLHAAGADLRDGRVKSSRMCAMPGGGADSI